MTFNKTTILVAGGAVAALALVVGGGAFAWWTATKEARDRIDAFLIRSNLVNVVSYDSVSATPFGTVKVSDLRVTVAPGAEIRIGKVKLADLSFDGNRLESAEVEADGISIPVKELAKTRAQFMPWLRELVGLGYDNLKGSISAEIQFDDDDKRLQISLEGEGDDAGSWSVRTSLANVSPAGMDALSALITDPASLAGAAFRSVLGAPPASIAEIQIGEIKGSLDNGELHAREKAIPDRALPPDLGTPEVIEWIPEEQLVRAGMVPSAAKDTRTSVIRWMQNGGKVTFATDIKKPVPLYKGGSRGDSDPLRILLGQNQAEFAFPTLAAFVAATNLKIEY